jgi:hypothetical protein
MNNAALGINQVDAHHLRRAERILEFKTILDWIGIQAQIVGQRGLQNTYVQVVEQTNEVRRRRVIVIGHKAYDFASALKLYVIDDVIVKTPQNQFAACAKGIVGSAITIETEECLLRILSTQIYISAAEDNLPISLLHHCLSVENLCRESGRFELGIVIEIRIQCAVCGDSCDATEQLSYVYSMRCTSNCPSLCKPIVFISCAMGFAISKGILA